MFALYRGRRLAQTAAECQVGCPVRNRDLCPERVFFVSMSTVPREVREPAPERKAARGLRLAARWLRSRGGPRLGSCPVCHGRVQPDDALGLIGTSVAHAECALVSWLGPGGLSRELL